MDIVNQPVGGEGDVKVVLEGGKLKLVVGYDGKGVDGSLSVALDPKYFVDKLKAAIPGQIDDMLFDALLAMLLR